LKDRQALGRDDQFDASGCAGSSLDEAGAFKGEDHLVDGGRGDVEEALHVDFGGRAGIDAGIGVDERQVLPLPGRETRVGLAL